MNLPKIYFVANAKMPTDRAHGIQLVKMCEAILNSGVELELILPGRRASSPDKIMEYYGIGRRIPFKLVYVPDFYELGRAGFIISSIFFGISYFLFLAAKKANGEKFITYTVDLDHFSFLPLAYLGVPYFTEIHGEKKKTFLHKYFFRKANGIIAINRHMAEYIKNTFGVRPDRLDTRPNGIDLGKFRQDISMKAAREKLSLPHDKRLVLYVGRLYDWKGFGELFSAASMLPENIHMYFVGGSLAEAKGFAGNNIIPANMVFSGVRDHKEIPTWLAAADSLLLLGTARNLASYYYTSPMKLFEYMAAGRPIIASRTPANENIVSNNEVFFYEPDDHHDMVKQITRALSDKASAEPKVKASLAKAENFTWEKRAANILNFININS